jgi:hypothetical protein
MKPTSLLAELLSYVILHICRKRPFWAVSKNRILHMRKWLIYVLFAAVMA